MIFLHSENICMSYDILLIVEEHCTYTYYCVVHVCFDAQNDDLETFLLEEQDDEIKPRA